MTPPCSGKRSIILSLCCSLNVFHDLSTSWETHFFSILLYPQPYSTSNDLHRSMHFIACPNFDLKPSCHSLSHFSIFSIFIYVIYIYISSPSFLHSFVVPRPIRCVRCRVRLSRGCPGPSSGMSQEAKATAVMGTARAMARDTSAAGGRGRRGPRKMEGSPWLYRGCTVGVA